MEWYSNITGQQEALQLNYPDAKYAIANWKGPKGLTTTVSKPSRQGALITKRCKNPEDAMKIIN